MQKISVDLNKYRQKQEGPPHKLADEAQRLCDKIGVPFNTVTLRLLKKDSLRCWSIAEYMSEKGIANINYFTKAFYG